MGTAVLGVPLAHDPPFFLEGIQKENHARFFYAAGLAKLFLSQARSFRKRAKYCKLPKIKA